MFALSCEAARERLVVSYARRATGESRPRLPSVFFRELASQLVGERVSAERAPILSRPDVERIPGDAIGAPIPGRPLRPGSGDCERRGSGGDVRRPSGTAPIMQARCHPAARDRDVRTRRARVFACAPSRARAWSGSYSEWDGALGPAAREAIAGLVPLDRVFSPTALEHYAACPQQFLMSDVLRIRGVEEPERTVRIDALRRGNLFHHIFQRFHQEWGGQDPAVARARGERAHALPSPRRSASRPQARGETGYPAMWAADRLEVIEDCLRWLEVEREDPLTGTLPHRRLRGPLRRPSPGRADWDACATSRSRSISPRARCGSPGRIDRITWDADPPSRFRVIDYKTGKVRDEKPAQLQGGRMLQLPLYVRAGAQLLGVNPERRGGRLCLPDTPWRVQGRSLGSATSSPPARRMCSRCSARCSRRSTGGIS